MSNENLPLPQAPQQTLETLGTLPHCPTCALYALTRPQLKRGSCRICATKAWVDSPVLLLYLFREFVGFRNALRGLQTRDKDLTRTVMEDFDLRLTTLTQALDAHAQLHPTHPTEDPRPDHGYFETRIDDLSANLSVHADAPEIHLRADDRPMVQDLLDRVDKIEKELDRLRNT